MSTLLVFGCPHKVSAHCWCLGCPQGIDTLLVFGVPPRYQHTFRPSLLKWLLVQFDCGVVGRLPVRLGQKDSRDLELQ